MVRKLAERRLREFREKAGQLTANSTERNTPCRVLAERWQKIHNGTLKESSAKRNELCVKELNRVGAGIEPAPPTPPAIRVRSTAVPAVTSHSEE